MASYNVGSNNPMAKLNENQVNDIINLINLGFSQVVIAKKYDVDYRTISSIVCGRNWKHV